MLKETKEVNNHLKLFIKKDFIEFLTQLTSVSKLYLRQLNFWAKFFQNRCLLCGIPNVEGYFCLSCAREFSNLEARGYCALCGKVYYLPSVHLCLDCQITPPSWHNFGFGCVLKGKFQQILYEFKFKGDFSYLGYFTDLLERTFWEQKFVYPDLILPVPMSRTELRKRGFNQSLELAKSLAKRLGTKVKHNCLVKRKDTKPQRILNKKERQRNLKGAFEAKQKSLLTGQKVLVLDDIFTTGSTCREITKVLLQHGVRHIEVLVLARAIS
ncbi:MAG: ComF family protein [Desulfonauticus sp.]|nr:ComF family protein [Desulfonauticus sp.]